jgi:hypothetical protein
MSRPLVHRDLPSEGVDPVALPESPPRAVVIVTALDVEIHASNGRTAT